MISSMKSWEDVDVDIGKVKIMLLLEMCYMPYNEEDIYTKETINFC